MSDLFLFSVIYLISFRAFALLFNKETNTVVAAFTKRLTINRTGAIGVLESIYVHNAFQDKIGAASVAIFREENQTNSSPSLFSITAYEGNRHGKNFRISPVTSAKNNEWHFELGNSSS